jgi:hypothetical protein
LPKEVMFYESKPFEHGWQLVHKAAFLSCIPTEIKKIPMFRIVALVKVELWRN